MVAPAALAGARGFELGFKRVKRVERLRELLAQLGQAILNTRRIPAQERFSGTRFLVLPRVKCCEEREG